MKKVLFFFLFVVFTAGSIFAQEKREVNLSIVAGTKSDYADWTVYSSYDDDTKIGEINPGDKFKTTEICFTEEWVDYNKIWCHVKKNEIDGWVLIKKIAENPYTNDNWTFLETLKNGKKKYDVYKYESYTIKVIDNVYLRQTPWVADDNTILLIEGKKSIKYVTPLKIVKQKDIQIDDNKEIENNWLYVDYQGKQGWIFGGYATNVYDGTLNYYNPEEVVISSFNATEVKGVSASVVKNILFFVLKILFIAAVALVCVFLLIKYRKKLIPRFHKKNAPIENEEAAQDMESRQKESDEFEKQKFFKEKEELKIHDRISAILKYMNEGLYGKEDVIRLTLLSAIAGETIFFMGPPGTAKSMIARRMQLAFRDDTSWFEYLMSQFSTPDEICGPISLRKLGRDKYVRLTNGYLPKANIAFLDEIWKSGPAILNTLLTIINEKIYHNGNKPEKVPLIALVAASNEFPEKNKGLEALWDRFTIRVMVNPLQNDEDFFNMVSRTGEIHKPNFKYKSYLLTKDEVWDFQKKIAKIIMPKYIEDLIKTIRLELVSKNQEKNRKDDEKYYISDRKWKKIVNVLKASAFLNGRDQIDLMDCKLIGYCIWGTEAQRKESATLIEDVIKGDDIHVLTSVGGLKKQIEQFKKDVQGLNSANVSEFIISNARENITNKQYRPLEEKIINEIKKIEQMQTKEAAHFEGNLFVDDSFKKIVLEKLSKEQEGLEDLKLELEKIHHSFDPDSDIFKK